MRDRPESFLRLFPCRHSEKSRRRLATSRGRLVNRSVVQVLQNASHFHRSSKKSPFGDFTSAD